MDKVDKALKRLNKVQLRQAIEALGKITDNRLQGLDIKQLSGHKDTFRLRLGSLRIVFHRVNGRNKVTNIAHRSEKTYRDV